jgi:hypothetical protein
MIDVDIYLTEHLQIQKKKEEEEKKKIMIEILRVTSVN